MLQIRFYFRLVVFYSFNKKSPNIRPFKSLINADLNSKVYLIAFFVF